MDQLQVCESCATRSNVVKLDALLCRAQGNWKCPVSYHYGLGCAHAQQHFAMPVAESACHAQMKLEQGADAEWEFGNQDQLGPATRLSTCPA